MLPTFVRRKHRRPMLLSLLSLLAVLALLLPTSSAMEPPPPSWFGSGPAEFGEYLGRQFGDHVGPAPPADASADVDTALKLAVEPSSYHLAYPNPYRVDTSLRIGRGPSSSRQGAGPGRFDSDSLRYPLSTEGPSHQLDDADLYHDPVHPSRWRLAHPLPPDPPHGPQQYRQDRPASVDEAVALPIRSPELVRSSESENGGDPASAQGMEEPSDQLSWTAEHGPEGTVRLSGETRSARLRARPARFVSPEAIPMDGRAGWVWGNPDLFAEAQTEVIERLADHLEPGSDPKAALGTLIDFKPMIGRPNMRQYVRIRKSPSHRTGDRNKAVLFKDIMTPNYRIYFQEDIERSHELWKHGRAIKVFSIIAVPWSRDSSQPKTLVGEVAVLPELAFKRGTMPKKPFKLVEDPRGPLFG